MATNQVQEPQGLIQLNESKKLILDDKTRVTKILDRGESFHLRRAPPSRNDRRQADPKDDDELVEDIAVEVANALDPERKFIPLPEFARIMTFDRVRRIVNMLESFRKERIKDAIAREVFNGRSDGSMGLAVKLLAVLIGIGQKDLAKHLNDGLRDSRLPLKKHVSDEQQYLSCRKHRGHSTLNRYRRPQVRESFAQWSYTLSAPFIKWEPLCHSHYVLDTGDIVPMEIIHKVEPEDGASDNTERGNSPGDGDTYGGFSEVYKVKIHKGHWDFGDHGMRRPQHFFALKKLTSHSRHSFILELSSLLFTGQQYKRKHPIQLLTSFEVVNPAAGGMTTYDLLFDWAEGSLERFWQNNRDLVGPKAHCRWLATQFFEISYALECVHNDRAPTIRYLEDRGPNKDLYGRHGDIKPANFLWFHNSSSFPGLLALSDFGLDQHPVVALSWTFRSAKFPQGPDIFSLGCVFLEYVTWFLLGFDAVKTAFPEARLENDVYGFNSDTFFR